MKKYFFLLISTVYLIFGFNQVRAEKEWPILQGPYFGQKAPGIVPEIFAHQVLANSINTMFSPDGTEFFFVKDMDGNDTGDILWIRQVKGIWIKPAAAPFNSNYTDNDICITPDGKIVFFRSWRPIAGKTIRESASHIWFSQKENGKWSRLINMGKSINTELMENCPTLSPDGKYFFFMRYDGKTSDAYWVRSEIIDEMKLRI
jgi:Tol biopolymer transport system component